MSEGIVEFRAVSILDMKDGEVTKVEIEGMDGNFVKASDGSKKSRRKALFNPKVGEEESVEEITIDGKELAEVIAPSVHSFKNGDKVRLISGGGEHPLIGYKNGKTYQVDSHGTWGDRDLDKFVRIVGGDVVQGFAKPEQLEVVEEETEEEEAEESELKVGDYAKFTEDECEHRKGEIVKIVEIDDDLYLPCKLEELDGTHHGFASKAVLVKVSPEERGKGDHAGYDCEGTALYVGDYVVGVSNRYLITSGEMLLGKVVTSLDSIGDIEIVVIKHTDPDSEDSNEYDVKPQYFRKATADEIALYT